MKMSDKQLDKEIAQAKKEQSKKRGEMKVKVNKYARLTLTIVLLVGMSLSAVVAYANGILTISDEHIRAIIALLLFAVQVVLFVRNQTK